MNSYDLIARTYDAHIDAYVHGVYLDLINRYHRAGTFLEIGCGSGLIVKRAHQYFTASTALDTSETMLEIARKRLKNTDVTLLNHSMHQGLNTTFDTIVAAFDVFNHVDDFSQFASVFSLWMDHLSEGGVMIFDLLKCAYLKQLDGHQETMTLDGEPLVWRSKLIAPCQIEHQFYARPKKAVHRETAFSDKDVLPLLKRHTILDTIDLEERTIYVVKK